jgi:transposase
MFLRSKSRFKNGKSHRYFSVVENRRVSGGKVCQRQVLYLGEINDAQEEAWRRTLCVFDERDQKSCQMTLFPDDRPIPADAVNALSVRLTELRLRHPRHFGDCWLGLELWRELALDVFWGRALSHDRGAVAWEKVLALLTVNRLIAPGSEWKLHREWFLSSAMGELLDGDFALADKDRLYRCLDRLLEHKDALCQHLVERWRNLFDVSFDVLLYDLTSTYFEGRCRDNPKAVHGHSRDNRSDCRQVVIALVATPDGLPLAYEVMAGNTSDKTTLRDFLKKIQTMYGKARRVWVMDRGIPTEATLEEMRSEGVNYLVGTPRTLLSRHERALLDKPWERVHEQMRVKLLKQGDELYVLAQSGDRQKKENAMRRRKLQNLVAGLNRIKRNETNRDRLIRRVAVLKKEAGRVFSFIKVTEPKADEPVNRQTFRCVFDRAAWRKAMEWDGAYLLRGHFTDEEIAHDGESLWRMYMQLVEVEGAFKNLKSEVAIRPVFHQLEHRVEAHILVAFLGYCLLAHLKMKLAPHAPGLSARSALEKLGAIKLVDVEIPTTDGRLLILPRYTEPEAEQLMVLEKLDLSLPGQPPPRIRGGELELPTTKEASV